MSRKAAVVMWDALGRQGPCPHPSVLEQMEVGDLRMQLRDHGHHAQTVVVLQQHDDGDSVAFLAYAKGGAYHIRVADQPSPLLVEFLAAHWDTFTDVGYAPNAWFLNDCPRCGADAFHPCRALRRKGKLNRTVHKERFRR